MNTNYWMRRAWRLIALVFVLTACDGSGTGPTGASELPDGTASLAARNDSLEAATSSLAGASRDTGTAASRLAPRDREFAAWPLPNALALTEPQKAQIRALRVAHTDAVAADSAALRRVFERARAARAAGRPAAEIEAILAESTPMLARLARAAERLGAAIDGVLTVEQRRWLTRYHACLRASTPTQKQLQEVAALRARFREANAGDLQAIEQALARIAALRANTTLSERARQQQIASIFESIRPARERLSAAVAALDRAIAAVLPPRDCAAA